MSAKERHLRLMPTVPETETIGRFACSKVSAHVENLAAYQELRLLLALLFSYRRPVAEEALDIDFVPGDVVQNADVIVVDRSGMVTAVALYYDSAAMNSLKVLLKGRGWLGRRMYFDGFRCGIVIVENPRLAKTLFRCIEREDEIGKIFYKSVARALGMKKTVSR